MGRRGFGDDAIYFDHSGDCRDARIHKGCPGRWRGAVSLGYSPDGKRIRRKVSGRTKQDVKDKLGKLHSDLAEVASTRSSRTVGMVHNSLERAIRHAEANDYVRRNVAGLVKPPTGQEVGRPDRSPSIRLVRCWRPRRRRRWALMSSCAC